MLLDTIPNLVALDDRLTTAGQPTAEQFADIAAAGFEVVVNLAMGDGQSGIAGEGEIVAAHGMAYHHVPVVWDAPAPEDFARFVAVMDATAGERRFVHCALNYRVSMFTALYGQLRWGWPADRADAHVAVIWTPNETWAAFIAAVRAAWGLADGTGRADGAEGEADGGGG